MRKLRPGGDCLPKNRGRVHPFSLRPCRLLSHTLHSHTLFFLIGDRVSYHSLVTHTGLRFTIYSPSWHRTWSSLPASASECHHTQLQKRSFSWNVLSDRPSDTLKALCIIQIYTGGFKRQTKALFLPVIMRSLSKQTLECL